MLGVSSEALQTEAPTPLWTCPLRHLVPLMAVFCIHLHAWVVCSLRGQGCPSHSEPLLGHSKYSKTEGGWKEKGTYMPRALKCWGLGRLQLGALGKVMGKQAHGVGTAETHPALSPVHPATGQ